MTEREIDIVQKIGTSAFTVYSYVKQFPRSRNMDIEVDLNISGKTVISVLKKMQNHNIIQRKMITNHIREIQITSEKSWDL